MRNDFSTYQEQSRLIEQMESSDEDSQEVIKKMKEEHEIEKE